MTRLILIRHGETQWNIEKRYLGITDIDLNSNGKRQAKALAKKLKDEGVYSIYSSDRKRSVNFAKITFGLNKNKKAELKTCPELREINFGILEGMNYKDIMARYPELYVKWLKNPFRIVIPGGDRYCDFKKRVKLCLKKIISANKNKTVAVVTHAGPIRIIISDIIKNRDIWKIRVDNGSIWIVEYKGTHRNIKQLNYTSYYE